MGNKPVSGNKGAAAGSAPVDSDEYWWAELEKNLRPIKSCEEFCERFSGLLFLLLRFPVFHPLLLTVLCVCVLCVVTVKPEQYETSKKQFLDMIADGPEKDRDKPYVTREAWLACVPDTDASKKWVLNIWKCFDADRNNQLTVCSLVLASVLPFVFFTRVCAAHSWTSGWSLTASASTARWSSA